MSRVLDCLASHALLTPDAVALSGPSAGFTYAELDSAVARTAAALAALGPAMRPGAPVAIMLGNTPTWALIDLALMRLGWPSLPIPDFFTADQRAHALADAGAAIVLGPAEGLARPPEGTIRIEIEGVPVTAQALDSPPVALPPGTAKITYTSGSTGRPKGVCLSVGQMEAVAGSLVEVVGVEAARRHLPVLPFSILLENVAGLYATLIAGGCCHVLPAATLGLEDPFHPDLERLGAAIASEGATSLILVPELLRALVMVMTFTTLRLPMLKFVAVGGAKVAPQLLAEAAALGLPVHEGYGLSECASVVALNTPRASRPGAVGRLLPHLKVDIDAAGEVIVGPGSFLGYAGGRTHEGPLRTGDLGRIDRDGFLHIEGRRANTIINAFGRNISPEWVESELTAQPEIRQAVVFGEAQAELGALIVPLAADLDEAALARAIGRANANLPAYAQVRRWLRRPPLDPAQGELTGNGRVRRSVVLSRHAGFIDASPQEA